MPISITTFTVIFNENALILIHFAINYFREKTCLNEKNILTSFGRFHNNLKKRIMTLFPSLLHFKYSSSQLFFKAIVIQLQLKSRKRVYDERCFLIGCIQVDLFWKVYVLKTKAKRLKSTLEGVHFL